jgi:pyrroline-5-carboxylate reductase
MSVVEEHSMKVSVLGSGDVAKVLASGFLRHGHEVMLGARTPAKLQPWAQQNATILSGTLAEAARFGELIVLAVKGTAAPEAPRAASATNLAGKPVIDATKPIADVPPEHGVRQTHHVHLRERFMPQSRSSAGSWISTAGKRRTWARRRRPARSSRCVCCGASRDSFATTGFLRSSC